jgi:ABC-type sugar transport system permease subunit
MSNTYTKKAPKLLFFMVFLVLFFICESIYLSIFKSVDAQMLEKKIEFVKLCKLPDLAISTEATFVRHRTMSDIFSIYKDDASLREYFPSTYVYSHSHIINGAVHEK